MAGRTVFPVADDTDTRQKLVNAGLRPTRQRVVLAQLLFAKGDRHISAEELHEEADRASVTVSLATVYNTLHQFTSAGLLREVSIDSNRTYFDTNTSDHHHFFYSEDNYVTDVPQESVSVAGLPTPPEGMEIERVEVVIRLRRKT